MQKSLSEPMYFSLETILRQVQGVEIFAIGDTVNMQGLWKQHTSIRHFIHLACIIQTLSAMGMGVFFALSDYESKSRLLKTMIYN